MREIIWGIGVGHRDGEEGFLGQEIGGRAGEVCHEGEPVRKRHCRVIDLRV